MPVMNGPSDTKAIRSLGFSGLICGLTGNALLDEQEIFLNAGADYVFTKPMREQSLNLLLDFIDKYGCESTPFSRTAIKSLLIKSATTT